MNPTIPGLLIAVILLFSGCNSGTDSKGGSSHGSSLFEFKANVKEINHVAGILVTESEVYECIDKKAVKNIEVDTVKYAIDGGQLILLDEENCSATLLQGTSNNIIGTWKGGFENETAIPEKYRPDQCTEGVGGGDTTSLDFFKDLVMTVEVTDQEVLTRVDGSVCMGDFIAAQFGAMSGGSPGGLASLISIKEKGCSHVILENNTSKETARVDGSFSKEGMKTDFKYKQKTCAMVTPMEIPYVVPDCTIDREAAAAEFYQCVFASGFLFSGM